MTIPDNIPLTFTAEGITYQGIFERVEWTGVEFKYDLLVNRFHQGEMRVAADGFWRWGSNHKPHWDVLTDYFALVIEMTLECNQ